MFLIIVKSKKLMFAFIVKVKVRIVKNELLFYSFYASIVVLLIDSSLSEVQKSTHKTCF